MILISCEYRSASIIEVGLSQIFIPTQNLERAYKVDKKSKAVLSYFQYDRCAGPQKQEDIDGTLPRSVSEWPFDQA